MLLRQQNDMKSRTVKTLTPLILFTSLSGCDLQRMKKCEWYIVPNPSANEVMEPGWVSLCVANFKLGKQRCYFTAKPDFVEKINGIPFTYASMKYTKTFPRKILSVQTCKKEE